MTFNNFALWPSLAGFALVGAIAMAPLAAAAEATPAPAVPTAPSLVPAPPRTDRGAAALPLGGSDATSPQDQPVGGADPLVPYGTWAP